MESIDYELKIANRISSTVYLLEKIVQIGQRSIDLLNKCSFEDIWKITLGELLDRFLSSIDISSLLLKQFGNTPTGRQALSIQLRAGLQDHLILNYLFSFYFDAVENKNEETEDRLNQKTFSLRGDQLRHLLSHIHMLNRHSIINDKNHHLVVNSMANKYPEFIDGSKIDRLNPNSGFLYPKFANNKQMFERILTHKIGKHLAHTYDHYAMFSKVEHYGILSLDLKNAEEQIDNLLMSIDFIVHGLIVCHKFIGEEFGLKKQVELLEPLGKKLHELNKYTFSDSFNK